MSRAAQYKSLPLVVLATGLASGATSPVNVPSGLSDLAWVNKIVFYILADKSWDMRLANGDGSGYSADYSVGTGAATSGQYAALLVYNVVAGKYLGFAIKNTDVAAGNYTVRAELVGRE